MTEGPSSNTVTLGSKSTEFYVLFQERAIFEACVCHQAIQGTSKKSGIQAEQVAKTNNSKYKETKWGSHYALGSQANICMVLSKEEAIKWGTHELGGREASQVLYSHWHVLGK